MVNEADKRKGVLVLQEMEERKKREIEHSDRRRSIVKSHEYETDAGAASTQEILAANKEEYDYHFSNMKFYSVTGESSRYRDGLIAERVRGATCLDYCCGNGEVGREMALGGAKRVHGIDISNVGVANARDEAVKAGVSETCEFEVMDAESMTFADDTFDLVHEYGALHHLELDSAYRELARVTKPTGRVICTEALRHNPLIHWYRHRTPQLRTEWEVEHILGVPEMLQARKYFGKVDVNFFHLAALALVPFRNSALFRPLLRGANLLDRGLLTIPGVRRMAWIAVMTLSEPIADRPAR